MKDLKTRITDLGLTEEEASLLTPNAQSLTLGDLVNLRIFAKKSAEKGKSEDEIVNDFAEKTGLQLTISDVHSFEEAFDHYDKRQVEVTGDACCCCTCTPCCCCTA